MIGPLQQHILDRVRQFPGESMNFVVAPARWRHSAQRSVKALEIRGLLFIDRVNVGRQGWALSASEAEMARGCAARERTAALARLQRQAEAEPDLIKRMELIDQLGGLVREQIARFVNA